MLSTATARCGRWLLLAMPSLLALVFYPNLEAPFTDAKNALFYLLVGFVGIAAAFSADGRLQHTEARLVDTTAALLLLPTILTSTFSPWKRFGAERVFWIFAALLLFMAVRRLLLNRSQQLLISIAAAGCITVAIATLQLTTHFDFFRLFATTSTAPGRMALYGTLGNPDWLGAYLAVTLPASISCALLASRVRFRVLWSFASALSLIMTIATGSRAAMLATALALVTMAFLRGNAKVKTLVGILAIFVVVVAIVAPHNRRSAQTALHGRVVIWKTALSHPVPNVLIGSGPNTFSYLYPLRMGAYFIDHPEDTRFASYERHAQNDFVETYTETGALGLLALLAVFTAWATVCLRLRKRAHSVFPAASLSALVALLVLACFDFPLHRAETWALTWMWMTLPLLEAEIVAKWKSASFLRRTFAVVLVVVISIYGIRPLLSSHNIAIAQQREALGDLQGAEFALERAINIHPASATAQFDLVRILGKQERYAEALEQSQRAEQWLTEPELFLLRSRILRALGRDAEAAALLEQSAKRFSYSRPLAEELADFHGR